MSGSGSNAIKVPRPADEELRLAALHRYRLLDTPADADFDFLTELAAHVCDVPFAFVSLVDRDRVWVKSRFGMEARSVPRDDDYCSWSILEDVVLSIPDLVADPRTETMSMTTSGPCFRSYVGANLQTSDGHRIGSLCVLDRRPRTLTERQSHLLLRLSRQVMSLIELRYHEQSLAEALAVMERLATIDELTGLANRRVLMERLADEIERARRFKTPLAVVMMDLDHFKNINDEHGHAAGDVVLRNVGMILRERMRHIDLAGRYGGEELCFVLPGTPLSGGVALAESLRAKLASFRHEHSGTALHVTASFGVASLDSDAEIDPGRLLEAADEALYRAKRAGRNRVGRA